MKITIDQKMSNTGTIYDIASDSHDIVIDMLTRFSYAVILPSYYNAGWTRHAAEHSAIRAYRQWINAGYQGVTILDKHGNELVMDFDGNLVTDCS